MTRTRGPGNLVARRPLTVARIDVDAHDSYAAMIEHDFGGRQPSYRAIDDGMPPSTVSLMVRPLALFLFACTGFVVVLVLWLWQAGMFGNLRIGDPPLQPVPLVSWMGARQRAPAVPPIVAKLPTPEVPAAKPPEPKPEPGVAPDERSPEPAEPPDEAAAD